MSFDGNPNDNTFSNPAGMSSFFASMSSSLSSAHQTFDSDIPPLAQTTPVVIPSPAETTPRASTPRTSAPPAPSTSSSIHASPHTTLSLSPTTSTSSSSAPVVAVPPTTSETGSPQAVSTLSTIYTSAAVSQSGGASVMSEQKSCSGISCSTGLQAAIAVPVVIVGLGLLIAIFMFARRRRKDSKGSESGESPSVKSSRWARHLRVFSFDAELLIGGRSSSSNSVRSGPASRGSLRSHQPSVRSLESPAPPYRDAIASGQPMMERPSSTMTAPPAYAVAAAGVNRRSDRVPSRLSHVCRVSSDPFADPEEDGSEPTSPTESSHARRSIVRRSSSAYRPVGEDDVSFASTVTGGSDAGSIREAQVVRNVSGASRAQRIDVRQSQ